MISKKSYKRLFPLLKKYSIVFSILFILFFVGLIVGYKLLLQKPNYIYAKIKVGQGLWWATTAKPSIWYMQAINKGDTAFDTLGRVRAKILDKRFYLSSDKDEYDIYLTVKIQVSGNANTSMYSFNREVLSVGAPIEIQFPKENITGTVLAIQPIPFTDKLSEKTVYLSKRYAYPWEYNAIETNSILSDGQNDIVTILDKNMQETTYRGIDTYGNNETDTRGYITLKTKMKLKRIGTAYILGEDKIVKPGRPLNLSLSSFTLREFIVSKIE